MSDNWHYSLQLALLAAICGISFRIPGISERLIAACAVAVGSAAVALIAVVVVPNRSHGAPCMEHRILTWIPTLILFVIVGVFFTIRLAWVYKLRTPAIAAGKNILARAGAWYSDGRLRRAGAGGNSAPYAEGPGWEQVFDVDAPPLASETPQLAPNPPGMAPKTPRAKAYKQLHRIYSKHAPGKVPNISKLLDKHRPSEWNTLVRLATLKYARPGEEYETDDSDLESLD